jgi:diadenosine tetraphosphate (Ap4A) HIT family hydrolase
LQDLFKPHKLDVAALGNLVLQLHAHVIARCIDDIAWPRLVWGMPAARPYAPGN